MSPGAGSNTTALPINQPANQTTLPTNQPYQPAPVSTSLLRYVLLDVKLGSANVLLVACAHGYPRSRPGQVVDVGVGAVKVTHLWDSV